MAPQDGTAVWGGGSGGRGAAGGASLPDRGHRATTMPKISGELACSGTLTVSSGTWDLGPGTWAPAAPDIACYWCARSTKISKASKAKCKVTAKYRGRRLSVRGELTKKIHRTVMPRS